MEKFEAIGVVETLYFTVALEMLDVMIKSSNVKFISKESALGGKLVTLFVGGKVAEVTDAIDIIKELGETKHKRHLKNAIVISKPHSEILKYIIPREVEDERHGRKQNKKNTTKK